jgi:very-short-patch-repair endonuclease
VSGVRRIQIPLDRQCRACDLPEPVAEYRFHAERRWRFDFAWPERKVAVEIDGGIWVHGRHNRASGYLADLEKLNAAAEAGWRVLRYATGHVDMAQLARVLA